MTDGPEQIREKIARMDDLVMDDLSSLTDYELLQEATEQGVDVGAVGSAGRKAFERARILAARKRLTLVRREMAGDAGRTPAAYDRAKARSRLDPVHAENSGAASKLVQVGGEGLTPHVANQRRVLRAGMLQRTEQARDPRYDSGDGPRRPSGDAPRRMYAFFKSNRRVIAGSTIVAAVLALVYAFTLTPPSPLTVPTRVALDSTQKLRLQKMPCAQSVEGCDRLAAPALPRGTLPSAASLGAASPASLEMSDGLHGSNSSAADSADKAKSVTALQYAADQGHLAAQWKVGRMYAAGDGVPHDDLRAFVYFSQIANTRPDEPPGTAQAHIVANAFVALGHYYLTGIPNSAVAQDTARARELFAYAASYFGDTDAQYQLGRLYLDGSPSNPRQAARWFQLAATKGDCRAEAVLGDMLFQGQKVPRQAAHGLMWLTLSEDCAGPEENWIKPLYDNALRRATIDERVMALVFLEDWLKERARDANG